MSDKKSIMNYTQICSWLLWNRGDSNWSTESATETENRRIWRFGSVYNRHRTDGQQCQIIL